MWFPLVMMMKNQSISQEMLPGDIILWTLSGSEMLPYSSPTYTETKKIRILKDCSLRIKTNISVSSILDWWYSSHISILSWWFWISNWFDNTNSSYNPPTITTLTHDFMNLSIWDFITVAWFSVYHIFSGTFYANTITVSSMQVCWNFLWTWYYEVINP